MPRKCVYAITSEALPALREEYEHAETISFVHVGTSCVFFGKPLCTKALPFAELTRAYLRKEDYNVRLCCGRGTMASCFLMLVTREGQRVQQAVDREAHVRTLRERIAQRAPHVVIGYSKEQLACPAPQQDTDGIPS